MRFNGSEGKMGSGRRVRKSTKVNQDGFMRLGD